VVTTRRAFGALGRLLRIVEGVRLRREHFGGIAFAARTGTTVDVDREVFTTLQNLRRRGVQGEDALVRELCGRGNDVQQLTKAHRLLNQLVDLAILGPASQAEMTQLAGTEMVESEAERRVSFIRTLHAVWEVYEGEDAEEAPPRPLDREQGEDVVEEFQALLATE